MVFTETVENNQKVDHICGFERLKDTVAQLFSGIFSGKHTAQTDRLLRFELEIDSLDLLAWLRDQKNPNKVYWSGREHDIEMAGIGAANIVFGTAGLDFSVIINRLQQYLPSDNDAIRYYGGTRFSEINAQDYIWDKLGSYWFCVPRFEIVKRNNTVFCACNVLLPERSLNSQLRDSILLEFDNLIFDASDSLSSSYQAVNRIDFPDKSTWKNNVLQALESISNNILGKVVLARKSTIEFSDSVNAVALLQKLKLVNPDSFHFYIQPLHDFAFLGGSPERLYRRDKRRVYSEALAGTCIRGFDDEDDRKLERELLTSEKDLREHSFVHQAVKQALEQFCHSVESTGDLKVIKLARIQHLYSSFLATLFNGVSEAEILSSLHPTPAVGGVPTDIALKKLREIESFDRGWYAGPIGWVGSNHAEFAVAIRSGLVHNNTLTLFSGAGIVTGSEPLEEWEEIENKISNFLKILNSA